MGHAGNSSRGSFDFSIADVSDMPELDIYTNANPAVSSVTFYVNSPDAGTGYVDVFDLSGRKVWSSSATMDAGVMAATWDLLDAGAHVCRVVYICIAPRSQAVTARRNGLPRNLP